jgi:glyoxylase-like metal-dependent hydrolase (beta-lactamase superfamily II)
MALAGVALAAQGRPEPPSSPRIYVFDSGAISGLDVKLFNFAPGEIKEPNFVNMSYLVVHPTGTLMFDAGGIPDADFKADGTPITEGVITASRQLKPQLAAAGYRPADITYFAMSHYHSDHTANANDFAGATWIVQKAERDYMFQEKPTGIIRPAHYDKLKDAKTRILDNEDLDVFGDGMVVIMSTPGHTPGHQVLFVKLAKTGGVVLAGDLYHYPEEIATGRVPTFEFSPEQSKVSRARIAAFLKSSQAQLWIEHDIATHAKLPRAPQYVD